MPGVNAGSYPATSPTLTVLSTLALKILPVAASMEVQWHVTQYGVGQGNLCWEH